MAGAPTGCLDLDGGASEGSTASESDSAAALGDFFDKKKRKTRLARAPRDRSAAVASVTPENTAEMRMGPEAVAPNRCAPFQSATPDVATSEAGTASDSDASVFSGSFFDKKKRKTRL